jgi:adenosylcobinamide kinase / adenosylcobinamide-phosphate guanylyltransferase
MTAVIPCSAILVAAPASGLRKTTVPAGLARLHSPAGRLAAQWLAQSPMHSAPHTLVVVDCLTLWLTNLLMPYLPLEMLQEGGLDQNSSPNGSPAQQNIAQAALFLRAIQMAKGPVVIVSNEIGLGVIPMGRDVRAYLDALGLLNQEVAAVCGRVTLMAAGLPLVLKDAP